MTEQLNTDISLWEKYATAVEAVDKRLLRITGALAAARIRFALVGGQAVAIWIATKDPDAVRTTKSVDILVRRNDLPAVRKAARSVALEYFEVLGVDLITRDMLDELPAELAARLDAILTEFGR